MKNIILIFIIAHLLSTAYGISVIETVKPLVKKKLVDEGYILRKKNSMYKFNEGLTNFLKGFIPFYYAIKAFKLTSNPDPVYTASVEELYNRNYVTRDELEEEKARRELVKSVGKPSMVVEPSLGFNKSEKYVARRTDLILSRDYKDEVEYDIKHDDNLSITPFDSNVQIIKEVVREPEKKDIVKAIVDLNEDELAMLEQSVRDLIALKSHKKVLRYTDTRKVA